MSHKPCRTTIAGISGEHTKYGERGGDDDDDDYDDFVDDDHDFDKNGSDGDSPLLSPRPSLS